MFTTLGEIVVSQPMAVVGDFCDDHANPRVAENLKLLCVNTPVAFKLLAVSRNMLY